MFQTDGSGGNRYNKAREVDGFTASGSMPVGPSIHRKAINVKGPVSDLHGRNHWIRNRDVGLLRRDDDQIHGKLVQATKGHRQMVRFHALLQTTTKNEGVRHSAISVHKESPVQ